ncbi:hypothetical protein EDD18DRAFT_1085532, partial [Armillaria luteobubalina]
GPTSSVWHAYLNESRDYDINIVSEQRGEVNILLVFAGLFFAVVSNFITTSSDDIRLDYQKMSAMLLFDQINIQLALANGTSLEGIITSNADPTARFTPDPVMIAINGLWLTSLTLSLVAALYAILVDGWYGHYLSPIHGHPKAQAFTRHFRYKSLVEWNFPFSHLCWAF